MLLNWIVNARATEECTSSHTAILGEALKQEHQRPDSSSSKQKEMKTKGPGGAEASKNGTSKQTIINKGQNMKSPSSVKPDVKSLKNKSKEINLDSVTNEEEKSGKRKKEEEQKKPKSNSTKPPTQEAKRRKETKVVREKNSVKPDAKSLKNKSKEINLDSVKNEEEKSQKRKKEEEQKKPKSNSIKPPTQEAKHRKETKVEPQKNSVKSNSKKLETKLVKEKSREINLDSGRNKEEKSKKRKKEEELKKPESNGKKSPTQEAKRRKETKVEPEKNSGKRFLQQSPSKSPAAEHLIGATISTKKPSSGTAPPNSVKRINTSSNSEQGKKKKQKESGGLGKLKPNSPNSKVEAMKEVAPSKSKGQAQIATQTKPRPSSRAHSVKMQKKHKDLGKKKNPNAPKHAISASLEEKSKEPSVRRLKIMRALGLLPPVGSPFIRTGAPL
ncbi:hypothetical protein ACH5RR_026981 [Cinchona calisaya]|uniref:Uncharacterized protein n=1 Tax=Cinchona calisaya TaxID=153742 RepID=A0ABD2Z5A7_9GENT